jgi:catechol 2,3-dioxygenase-like lactoylglutathione lyase family enzyme
MVWPPVSAQSRQILRIQHVSLPIPATAESFEEARRFYTGILGLTETRRPDVFPGAGIWYMIGDQELHLFTEPAGVAANLQSRRHPCFQVEDVAGLRAGLDEAGVTTRDDDGTIPGRPRFFAVDPFDNTLEFVQFEADHW